MIYILYSNDYEVFLGGNYFSEDIVLIDQTEILLRACEEINVPMTLFCDVLFLWRYRELGINDIVDKVEKQLISSINDGHDVQAHIHPHWYKTIVTRDDSGYSSYNFDLNTFLLGNHIPDSGNSFEDYCAKIFEDARNYLEKILCKVNPDYKCVAFRAGGYGLQPNAREILHSLIKTGYLIDSSFVPGLILKTNVNQIDFHNIPFKPNYFISPESGIAFQDSDGIFEIPILTLRDGEARWTLVKAFIRSILRYLKLEKKAVHKPMGFSIQSTCGKKSKDTILKRAIDDLSRIKIGFWMLEICSDEGLMYNAAKYYIDKNYKDDDIYFSVSCHSKSLTPEDVKAFISFHRKLARRYGNEIQPISFLTASKRIGKNTV